MSKPATGYVRQRKNGLWEGQYTFQREKRSIYGQTREEVTQELERIIHSIEDGNYVRPSQHTLISWLRDWVKTYAKPTLRPSTSTNYEFTIERHFTGKLGNTQLRNISTRMLQNFFNRKLKTGRADRRPGGLSPKTLKNIRYMLHVALDQACHDRLIPFNPLDGVRLPVPDHPEQRVLTSEEKERICDHATILNTLYAKGVIILLTCGLRRGELLGLRWQDVDLTEGLIHVRHTMGRLKKFNVELSPYSYIRLDDYAPQSNHTALYLGPVKTKKSARTVYLPTRALQAFVEIKSITQQLSNGKAQFNPHNMVFCTEEGHPYEPKTLEEGFQNILTNLGLKTVNLHATRHTFATEALHKSTDIITVSEILGHTKPSTTLDMYGHTFDERKRALMAQM